MAMLTINGIPAPSPSEWDSPTHDLHSEDTGRNELGIAIIHRVRQGVYTLPLVYRGISSADVATLKELIKPKQFSVTFVTENGNVTKTMYAGGRTQKMIKYNPDYTKIKWDFSMTLVEV